MNKRGEVNFSIGLLIMVAVAVIVGAVLLQGTAIHVGQTSTTYEFNSSQDANNEQITPSAAGVAQDLTGQDLITLTRVYNESGAAVDCESNFTIDEGVSATTGVQTIQITKAAAGTEWCEGNLNITYTYGPDGYIDSAASRSVASLILIFFALAIGVIALVPVTRDKLFDIIGRIK